MPKNDKDRKKLNTNTHILRWNNFNYGFVTFLRKGYNSDPFPISHHQRLPNIRALKMMCELFRCSEHNNFHVACCCRHFSFAYLNFICSTGYCLWKFCFFSCSSAIYSSLSWQLHFLFPVKFSFSHSLKRMGWNILWK